MQAEFVEVTPEYLKDDKRKAIIAFVLVFLADTVVRWALSIELYFFYPVVGLASMIGTGLALLYWCRAHARRLDFRLPKHFPLAIILLGALALLWYLYKTRRSNGLAATVGKGFLFALALIFADVTLQTALALISDRTGFFS